MCVSMLQEQSESYWSIGLTILNGAYIEFDYDNSAMGFAVKNKNAS